MGRKKKKKKKGGMKEQTYRQKIENAIREFLALADIPLACPNIPLGNLPCHGRFVREVDFSKEIKDAPEGLDLRHHGRLDRVDLAEDDERAVILQREIERDGALVEPPAALRGGVVGLWVFELGALGEKGESFVDCFGGGGVVFGPGDVFLRSDSGEGI